MFDVIKSPFYPGSLLVILGYKCTNNCSYCYVKKNGAKLDDNMSLKTFEQVISWYEKYLETPDLPYKPSIALIGGEPLCYWEDLDFDSNLPRLGEIVRRHGKEIRLVSNGVLFNEHMRQVVKDNGIAMDISLDGDKISHDKNRRTKEGNPTWDKVMTSIQWLEEDGNDLRVRATVGQNNADRVYEMYLWLDQMGCRRFGIELDTFSDWSDKRLGILSGQYKKIVEHYIDHYDGSKSCFSLDRVISSLAPDFCKASRSDANFLRPCSMAILPDGQMKVNHNFPVWADKETAKLFEVGHISTGLNEEVVQKYLAHFGLLTDSCYYASNEENVCKTCPANGIMCQNPWCNTTLPKSVWIPDRLILCYTLRFISLFSYNYLRKKGYLVSNP